MGVEGRLVTQPANLSFQQSQNGPCRVAYYGKLAAVPSKARAGPDLTTKRHRLFGHQDRILYTDVVEPKQEQDDLIAYIFSLRTK